jgi:uncharacterized protein YycO
MNIGDIILYHDGIGFFSRSIRKLTKSQYNHIGIYCGDNIIAEAVEKGFVYTNNFNPKEYSGVDVYRLKQTYHFKKDKLKKIVDNYIGTKYGWFDICKLAVYQVTRIQILRTRTKRMICSEAVAQIYYDYGIDLFPEIKNYDYITPEDFAKSTKLIRIK